MNTKIDSAAQIACLREGDIIKKFPIEGLPEKLLEESQKERLLIYDIRSINKESKIIGLVETRDSRMLFASPGDINRQFISMDNMITENIWWLWRKS